ncbi:MAG TPA: phosphodiester glycosidase family protein [Ruminiclostridium sp.]|nr:phosphodiester glycosidase family protein [Ruminiclostridium sp.]
MRKFIASFFFCILFLSVSGVVQASDPTYQSKTIKIQGGTRAVHAVYVDLNDKNIRMESVMAKNTIGATDSLQNIARQPADSNTEVVAAINGTFFESDSDMKPWGTIESKGDFYRLGSSGSVIGFTTDNKPMIETLRVSIKGAINESWDYPNSWYAWNFNNLDNDPSSIIILNSAYGKTTGKHNKTNIIVDNRKVINIIKGDVAIPATGYVIVTQDSSVVKKFKIGDSVDYKYETIKADSNSKSSPVDWSKVRTTVGAGPTLLKSGVILANGKKEGFTEAKINTARSQRSFAGYTKNNTLILATVPNVTVYELAEVAKAMGCVDALNLDGGASSGLYYKGRVVTTPGRKLSNALVVTKLKSAPPRLVMNGKEFIPKNELYVSAGGGSIMVPVTGICNRIYAFYSVTRNSININKYSIRLAMTPGSRNYTVNGKSETADSPPEIKNGVAYIPLQIIADLYNGSITYDSKNNVYNASINVVSVSDLIQKAADAKSQNMLDEAVGYYLDALELDPDNKMCHYRLGYLYYSTKDTENSIYHFKEFLKYEPDNVEVMGCVAWGYYSENDMPSAIGYFQKALAIKKDNPANWIALGQCYQSWSQKQYEKAIDCYETALSYKPTTDQTATINQLLKQCRNLLGKS